MLPISALEATAEEAAALVFDRSGRAEGATFRDVFLSSSALEALLRSLLYEPSFAKNNDIDHLAAILGATLRLDSEKVGDRAEKSATIATTTTTRTHTTTGASTSTSTSDKPSTISAVVVDASDGASTALTLARLIIHAGQCYKDQAGVVTAAAGELADKVRRSVLALKDDPTLAVAVQGCTSRSREVLTALPEGAALALESDTATLEKAQGYYARAERAVAGAVDLATRFQHTAAWEEAAREAEEGPSGGAKAAHGNGTDRQDQDRDQDQDQDGRREKPGRAYPVSSSSSSSSAPSSSSRRPLARVPRGLGATGRELNEWTSLLKGYLDHVDTSEQDVRARLAHVGEQKVSGEAFRQDRLASLNRNVSSLADELETLRKEREALRLQLEILDGRLVSRQATLEAATEEQNAFVVANEGVLRGLLEQQEALHVALDRHTGERVAIENCMQVLTVTTTCYRRNQAERTRAARQATGDAARALHRTGLAVVLGANRAAAGGLAEATVLLKAAREARAAGTAPGAGGAAARQGAATHAKVSRQHAAKCMSVHAWLHRAVGVGRHAVLARGALEAVVGVATYDGRRGTTSSATPGSTAGTPSMSVLEPIPPSPPPPGAPPSAHVTSLAKNLDRVLAVLLEKKNRHRKGAESGPVLVPGLELVGEEAWVPLVAALQCTRELVDELMQAVREGEVESTPMHVPELARALRDPEDAGRGDGENMAWRRGAAADNRDGQVGRSLRFDEEGKVDQEFDQDWGPKVGGEAAVATTGLEDGADHDDGDSVDENDAWVEDLGRDVQAPGKEGVAEVENEDDDDWGIVEGVEAGEGKEPEPKPEHEDVTNDDVDGGGNEGTTKGDDEAIVVSEVRLTEVIQKEAEAIEEVAETAMEPATQAGEVETKIEGVGHEEIPEQVEGDGTVAPAAEDAASHTDVQAPGKEGVAEVENEDDDDWGIVEGVEAGEGKEPEPKPEHEDVTNDDVDGGGNEGTTKGDDEAIVVSEVRLTEVIQKEAEAIEEVAETAMEPATQAGEVETKIEGVGHEEIPEQVEGDGTVAPAAEDAASHTD